MKPQRWFYATLGRRAWLPQDLKNKVLKPLVNRRMIVKRDDKSTTEGGRRIQLLAINCGIMEVLKWILVKVNN